MLIHPSRKFGKLHIKESAEVARYSKKKVVWVCECGTERLLRIANVLFGNTSSCGQCEGRELIGPGLVLFGQLSVILDHAISAGSGKVVTWTCSCGRVKEAPIYRVTGNSSASCGRCNEISAKEMSERKFGSLMMKFPEAVLSGSGKVYDWRCDCGGNTIASVISVLKGKRTSCGRCHVISGKEMAARKFGRLRMTDPVDVFPYSEAEVMWRCDCGKDVRKKICNVVNGKTTNCGLCNAVTAELMGSKKFGRLSLKVPIGVLPGSKKKEIWRCDCGGSICARVSDVYRGKVKSCGACYVNVRDWYVKNQDAICALTYPVDPSDFPPGGLEPVAPVTNATTPFRATCPVCGGTYFPAMHNVKRGASITCGCTNGRTSSHCLEISESLSKLGIPCQLEFEVGGLRYDVAILPVKVLLELQGLYWHSMKYSRSRDLAKRENARAHGYVHLCVFEDEWKHKRDVILSHIQYMAGVSNPVRLRPSSCDIDFVQGPEADLFYDRNHYIGPCRPKVSFGVQVDRILVACMSFSSPTRQSPYEWELVRMASDPNFLVHGVWSKLLKVFLRQYAPNTIVSFSDNRLFSGNIYGKLGFIKDGSVKPDYYWVKGNRRHHKSSLRKTQEERSTGLTETQLREAQGYRKIWDMGKTRWVWNRSESWL